jgi:hypothetical protein
MASALSVGSTELPAVTTQALRKKARSTSAAPPSAVLETSAPLTSAPLTSAPLRDRASRTRFDPDDFFGQQPASTSSLPDPTPLLENLTRCVIEVIAGARDLEQVARWVTDDVYRHLLKRVVISTRARQARGQRATRPAFSIGSTSIFEPRDGVVEAVIIVNGRARTRAVAIRLEGLDSRWRATAINVL